MGKRKQEGAVNSGGSREIQPRPAAKKEAKDPKAGSGKGKSAD